MMPLVLAAPALFLSCQALPDKKLVQSREPEVVIVTTVIERRLGSDFLSQSFGPFPPRKTAVLAKRKSHGEGLGLPRRGEDGTRLILRQARQAAGLMAFQDKAPTDRD
jgi:hypothetical protein